MIRTIYEILMDLHTIPTKTKGDNPMDRVSNAEAEIEQYLETKCNEAVIKKLSSFLSYSPTENNLSCFFERASEGRKLDELFELCIKELKSKQGKEEG